MSAFKSYFKRNDTLIYNSYTNTGRNPVVELFFGRVDNVIGPIGFSRFIFDLDLTQLQQNYDSGVISLDCSGSSMTHTLRMTNTSSFDEELLNTTWSNGRRRATSFDLILFRIPKVSGTTGNPQTWDEGVGYDYYESSTPLNSSNSMSIANQILTDKAFSDRPVNWFQRETISNWSYPGIYDNTNSQTGPTEGLNYSGLTIIDRQHFEFGNEDIEFNMTNEINDILTGATTGSTGWGIAFVPQVENITGMTESYAVGFFSRHTQTFYEPYLETNYDDLIQDDRNTFYEGKENNLYLYAYTAGNPINFDVNPTVDILDESDDPVFTSLPTCLVTKGVYKVEVPAITADTVPCMYYDVWKGLEINGKSLSNVENDIVLKPNDEYYSIGTTTKDPEIYGFEYYGIKQNEKILSSDVRKVSVIIKRAYTTNVVLNQVDVSYRVYVREGTTEVMVQDWTQVNRTPDGYYFVFDTRDKIPNEYFIDIQVNTDQNVDTYKRQIQFQIVNNK